MKNNPYLSNTFKTIWLKHFYNNKAIFHFKGFPYISFIKHPKLRVFFNVGKTNTKGITYQISEPISEAIKGCVVIIYDVPDNHEILKNNSLAPNVGVFKINQYPGFRCNLKDYKSLNTYMLQVLSRKSRYKFNRHQRKLASLDKIRTQVFYGDISEDTYETLFNSFYELLVKRFTNKKITNNNLSETEWAFYKALTYPMICNKEAALFVIYQNNIPIAITLTNFSKNTMFDVIRAFDIDYAQMRLGHNIIMKQITWCISHNISYLDFSKGDFEYKDRWTNEKYTLEYHIYYDNKSLYALMIAFSYKQFYKLKYRLRQNNILNLVHKWSYYLKN